MLKPEIAKLQRDYDDFMEEKALRHLRLKRELEERLEEEDFEGLSAVIREAHRLYRSGVATKMELRKALRQYGSAKFVEMWDLIPFENEDKKTSFLIKGDSVVFYRDGEMWDWTGVPDEIEILHFNIWESVNTGQKTVTWSDDQEHHAIFNMKNMAGIREVLNRD